MSASDDVWTRYWSGAGARAGAGCLPNAGPVEAAQRQVWQGFARRLQRRARLLDLATGNGIVLAWIAAARPDLKLVGVDAASMLPPAPHGATLRAGVPLERLPFPDSAFDAATSQFGFEYGDVRAASGEAARVLKPGAPMLMIVHHHASAIVAHNRARAEALCWATGEYLAKAAAFAASGGGLAVPQSFRAAPGEAARRFPAQGAAAEFAAGLLQRLEVGRERGPAAAQALVREIGAEALGEIERIGLLERAARDEDGAEALVAELSAAGFAIDPPAVVREAPGGSVLAWLISGRR